MEKTKEEKFSITSQELEHDKYSLCWKFKALYNIKKHGKHDSLDQFTFKTTINTSSCGTLQIGFSSDLLPELSLENKKYILDEILKYYDKKNWGDKYNNIFFIDRKGGCLEYIFAELGFKMTHSYRNYQTNNIVQHYNLNRYTEEEINEKYKNHSW